MMGEIDVFPEYELQRDGLQVIDKAIENFKPGKNFFKKKIFTSQRG